ncbi:Fc.00g071510.m01.CDS01 [Cosmosporella sp. VM-42]
MSCFGDKKSASAIQKNPNIIRKLGGVEKVQSAQHLLGLYYGCAVACRYAIPDALLTSESTGPSLEDVVEKAFALAILEHPLFQVGLVNEDSKKPYWVQIDRIDLRNLVEWRTVPESENYQDILREVLEWQVNNRFSPLETEPRWRSVILRPANSNFVDLVFGWDHAAGDGKSGKIFHESLLKCLNLESGGKNTSPLKDRSFEVPVTKFTPPLDHLLKFPISCGFFLSEGVQSLKPSFLVSESPYTTKWAPVQSKSCTTRLSLLTVEEEVLQGVLKECRQHKTTFTALLHALTLVSLANRLPKDKARAFQTGTPICVRRMIHPSPTEHPDLVMEQTVANSVTYWLYKFDEDVVAKVRAQASNAKARPESDVDLEATLWSAATRLRQDLSKKLESGAKNDMLGLVKFVGDWRKFMKDGTKSARDRSWEVSNLGVMNGEVLKEKAEPGNGENWRIDHAIFTQSSVVAGPAICINPIAVKGKGLTVTCVWQIEVIDDDLVQGLSSDLEAWLNGLGKDGRIPFKLSE